MHSTKAVLLLSLLLSAACLAQTTVQIRGKDGTAVPRDVLTDSQGRIITSGTMTDGGVSVTVVAPHCTSTANTVTSVGTTAVNVPASADGGVPTNVATRWSIYLCNSDENSGTPKVKCTSDGTTPVMGNTNAGEVLGVADCVTYYTDAGVKCISDTASTAVHGNTCF